MGRIITIRYFLANEAILSVMGPGTGSAVLYHLTFRSAGKYGSAEKLLQAQDLHAFPARLLDKGHVLLNHLFLDFLDGALMCGVGGLIQAAADHSWHACLLASNIISQVLFEWKFILVYKWSNWTYNPEVRRGKPSRSDPPAACAAGRITAGGIVTSRRAGIKFFKKRSRFRWPAKEQSFETGRRQYFFSRRLRSELR
jgi:hypothetical protein